MSKLFTEAGFLSDEGRRVFKETIDKNISMLLGNATNENELRLIGSLIHQRVGQMVTDRLIKKD